MKKDIEEKNIIFICHNLNKNALNINYNTKMHILYIYILAFILNALNVVGAFLFIDKNNVHFYEI